MKPKACIVAYPSSRLQRLIRPPWPMDRLVFATDDTPGVDIFVADQDIEILETDSAGEIVRKIVGDTIGVCRKDPNVLVFEKATGLNIVTFHYRPGDPESARLAGHLCYETRVIIYDEEEFYFVGQFSELKATIALNQYDVPVYRGETDKREGLLMFKCKDATLTFPFKWYLEAN